MKSASISYTSSSSVLQVPLSRATHGSWQYWGVWCFVLVLLFTVFFTVIDVAPFLHIDEFMTVDLGRVVLHSDSDWSIAWMMDVNQPAFVFFYLGPVLQEYAYQVGGQLGPRVSGIIGAFAAGTVMVGWLIGKRTPPYVALLFGLVFLLDPIFVQAYTIGRVDGWTMAVCLGSCCVLRYTIYKGLETSSHNVKLLLISSGSLTAIAFFIWPSAIFLLPLIMLELGAVVDKCRKENSRWKATLFPVFFFCTGGFIAAIILLIPIAPQMYKLFNNVVEGLMINMRTGSSDETIQNSKLSIRPLIHLFQVLKFSPVLLLLALLGVARGKKLKLLLAGMAAIILMLCTVVYSHRIQYLLPYFIIAAAGLFKEEYSFNGRSDFFFTKTVGLALLLIWPITLSLILRSIIALDDQQERDRKKIHQLGEKMIGSGDYSVYSFPYEFYYVGRNLGWRMYKPYLAIGDDPLLNRKVIQQIISKVDFAIMPQPRLTKKLQAQLQEGGMLDRGSYYLYRKPTVEASGKVTNMDRLRHFYFIPKQPYGPYRLYQKGMTLHPLSRKEH